MKKRILVICIFILIVSILSAAEASSELKIKAYKKDKSLDPTHTLKIIDALTGSLEDIKNKATKEIEIDNYVNKYLGTFDDKTGISKRAIFSIHIGGNRKGSFTVNVTFSPLALSTYDSSAKTWKADKNTDGTLKGIISVQYWLCDMNFYFTSTGTASANDETFKETIEKQSPIYKGNVAPYTTCNITSSSTGILSYSWTVTSTTTDTSKKITANYWDVEAMFAMIIDSESYSSSENADGTYAAPITISFTYN